MFFQCVLGDTWEVSPVTQAFNPGVTAQSRPGWMELNEAIFILLIKACIKTK